jgi:hypothetical protein
MDVDHQSEIEELSLKLEQNPYDYDAHVHRISLARQMDIQSQRNSCRVSAIQRRIAPILSIDSRAMERMD